MKKLMLVLLIAFVMVPMFGQVDPAVNSTDSTGTAVSSHWQAVRLYSGFNKPVTFYNKDTSDSLTTAINSSDTLANQTKFQKAIRPGGSHTVWTTNNYVYVKAVTNTATYSVYIGWAGVDGAINTNDSVKVFYTTPQPVSVDGVATEATLVRVRDTTAYVSTIVSTQVGNDTTNARLGRIERLLPAGIGTASDTLNGPYNATPYAVGDIKQDSTAKWIVFNIAADAGVIINASAVADTANATANVRRLLIVADTTGWGVLTADNAQFALTAAKAGKVIGEIVFAMKIEGTGSTAAYRSGEVRQWFRTVTNQKLFGLVVMDGAYTPKKREQSTFTLTFIKQN